MSRARCCGHPGESRGGRPERVTLECVEKERENTHILSVLFTDEAGTRTVPGFISISMSSTGANRILTISFEKAWVDSPW
jgi:hypothetical protein